MYLPEVSPLSIFGYISIKSSRLTVFIDFELLEKSIKTVSLGDLIDIFPKMLKGETSGRDIVDLNK